MIKSRICFIDLSFHEKTGSTRFVVDLLRKRFDVRIYYDHSWIGGQCPEFEEINRENFSIIIFFQVDPRDHAHKLKCQNIVFFPMFDSFGLSNPRKEYDMRAVHFINFSKAIHDSVSKLHGASLYAKYFPDPTYFERSREDAKGLFYWRRTDFLSWNLVKKIIGEQDAAIPIHCHTAIDPGFSKEYIPKSDIQKYNMSFSDWFEGKDQYLSMVSSKQLFVAPREYEGIGFSFLEAMSMGKAVIANDMPTMNEYIEHETTGYLFRNANPEFIDLSRAKEIGENARESVYEGWKVWQEKSLEILDYIECIPNHPTSASSMRLRRLLARNVAYSFLSQVKRALRICLRLCRVMKKHVMSDKSN